MTKLKALQKELILANKSDDAAVANTGSYQKDLAKYDRQEQSVDLAARIPDKKPALETFTTALIRTEEAAAVTVRNVVVTPVKTTYRDIPATTERAFRWEDSDLLVVERVSLVVDSLTRHRFQRWFATLPTQLGRLFLIKEVKELPGSWAITGEIYSWREVTVPEHVPPVVSLDEKLKAVGLNREELSHPLEKERLKACEDLTKTMAARTPQLKEALTALQEGHYRLARWGAFKGLVTAVQTTTLAKLLGEKEEDAATPKGHH